MRHGLEKGVTGKYLNSSFCVGAAEESEMHARYLAEATQRSNSQPELCGLPASFGAKLTWSSRLAWLLQWLSELQLDLRCQLHRKQHWAMHQDGSFNILSIWSGLMHWFHLWSGPPEAPLSAVGRSQEPLRVQFEVWATLRTKQGNILTWDLHVGLCGLNIIWTVTCTSCISPIASLNSLCHTLWAPHWLFWA